MSALQWFLVIVGPFLIATPIAVIAELSFPGFLLGERRPQPRPARVRFVAPARHWAVAPA